MKPMKAISTRTRSRGRQTSLLDSFDAPPVSRTMPSSSRPSSSTAPAASNAKPQASTRRTATNNNNNQSKGAKRTASSRSSGSTTSLKTEPKASNNKRRRVAAAATSTKTTKTSEPNNRSNASHNKKKSSGRSSTDAAAPLTVTPSPATSGRKAPPSSSSNSNDESNEATTPLRNNEHAHKLHKCDNEKDDEEVTATPASKFNRINRQITLDTTASADALTIINNPTPSFHQPWQTAHISDVPKGVIDIDSFPHQCCHNSLSSHAGYSWITSKRRCHCQKDADHCSRETTLEVYMGTYGMDLFGKGSDLVKEDWKTEQWWLDLLRKERSNLGKKIKSKGSRSSSPRSNASDNLLPIAASVEEHVDYMPRQTDLSETMRAVLIDWLVELAEEYKLDCETLYLTTTLVDRSLACSYQKGNLKDEEGGDRNFPVVSKNYLQCIGCACTLIASKLLEIIPPTPDEMAYISDDAFSRIKILEAEAEVCDSLKFNFNFKTPYNYIERFLRASHASSESSLSSHRAAMGRGVNNANNPLLERLVFYLCDLSMLEYKLVLLKPSLIAASAVYLARATLGIREPTPIFDNEQDFGMIGSSPSFLRVAKGYWSKTLEHYTGYDMWDLEDTVKTLLTLQESAESSRLKSIFSKHKSEKYMCVALKTVLNESDLGFF